jgi:hypothetical protein
MGTSDHWETQSYYFNDAEFSSLPQADRARIEAAIAKRERKNDKRLKDSKID